MNTTKIGYISFFLHPLCPVSESAWSLRVPLAFIIDTLTGRTSPSSACSLKLKCRIEVLLRVLPGHFQKARVAKQARYCEARTHEAKTSFKVALVRQCIARVCVSLCGFFFFSQRSPTASPFGFWIGSSSQALVHRCEWLVS